MPTLITMQEYLAMSDDAAIEYEETVVQPIYDDLYSIIKYGRSTHTDRCTFLDAVDQYNLTRTAAEDIFLDRRLRQLHDQHPELHDRLEEYKTKNTYKSEHVITYESNCAALMIQVWWHTIRSQLVVCYRCGTLGTPICKGSRKCSRCYEEQYNPDYGWDTY